MASLPPLTHATVISEYGERLEDPTRPRTNPDPRLYSPVYDGRIDPKEEDPFPHVQSPHLRDLLEQMSAIVKIKIEQSDTTTTMQTPSQTQPRPHPNSCSSDPILFQKLCQNILTIPSPSQRTTPLPNDHVYETCRLTSVFLVRSLLTGRSWQALGSEGTAVADLMHSLYASDPGADLWGERIGLLHWVLLVWYCASYNTEHYIFLHSLTVRMQFELSYAYKDWHGACLPMVALSYLMPLEQRMYEHLIT